MKFAHIADCHVGSWREPRLRELSLLAFSEAVGKCISENVDFVLIAGDLFNTSLPSLDSMKVVFEKLRHLKEKGIGVYAIEGSHDFSPSGKTMVSVLESAGLLVNVGKFEQDENGKIRLKFAVDRKTGAKITGVPGKKGGLEKNLYNALDRQELEREKGFRIFMFHSAINEMKPGELYAMDSIPASLFPKGFDYYAGGHVHIAEDVSVKDYKCIVYPGPLFPNSFSELEKLGSGSLVIVEDSKIKRVPLELKRVISIKLDCDGKTVFDAEQEMRDCLEKLKLENAIVAIRLSGTLSAGKATDIKFRQIIENAYSAGAYLVVKNTNQLHSREFAELKQSEKDSVEEMESEIIEKHSKENSETGIFSMEREKALIEELMHALSAERLEGERRDDFDERIKKASEKILGLKGQT